MEQEQAPARMSVGNLITGRTLEAMYNPTEFEESVAPGYARLKVLGHSHEPLQYQGTGNHTFSFDLSWSAFDPRGIDLAFARRFMLALCYSPRSAQTVQAAEPPRALFLWPTLAAIVAKLTELKIKHQDFAKSGATTRMVMSMKLEEARAVRLYSEDVLDVGTLRGS